MTDPNAIYDFGGVDVFVYEVDGRAVFTTSPPPWDGQVYDSPIGDYIKRASTDYRRKGEEVVCTSCNALNRQHEPSHHKYGNGVWCWRCKERFSPE